MSSEYEKKLIKMQYDLKEDRTIMSDYFKDLENWTNEIKEKEMNLKIKKSDHNQNENLPPIRSLPHLEKKKKKKLNKSKSKHSIDAKNLQEKSKIQPRSYKDWDKFDVEAACEKIDKMQSSSSSEYTTDEEWEIEQRKNRANLEKERGNLFFKDNSIDEAINCYTRAIDLDPYNAIFPANRAMCLLNQEKYASAELDCTLSIKLDSKYVKAYLRRGIARMKLNKYEDAYEDFKKVIELEPNNKQAKEELKLIENILTSKQLVYPIYKPIEKRSQKSLIRINIEEINDEIEIKKPQINPPRPLDLNEKIKTEEEKHSIKPIPNVPTNAYQFQKDWYLLSNNFENLKAYFKQIPPESYSKLFLNGLESEFLSKILRIFKEFITENKNVNIYRYMDHLRKVKRFETQILFLTNEDKKIISDLLRFINENSNVNEDDMKHLEKSFQL